MAAPILRQSFASSSRLTLHHLPFSFPLSASRCAAISIQPSALLSSSPSLNSGARYLSSLSQAPVAGAVSDSGPSFDGITSHAYSGSVGSSSASAASSEKAKGKLSALHPTPPPSSSSPLNAQQAQAGLKATPPPAQAAAKRRPGLKAKKSAISMTPDAISRLEALLSSPTEPRLLRISVKSRGCAGMAYHLDYVTPPGGKFDEVVEQDGVRVLIDSKALFSIIGSRMDWRDNGLSAGFVFDNPNVVDTCGCGESFNIRP